MFKGKKIVLGITGSIAAYKAAILVRSLVKNGAQVRVIMTPLAKEFISPLTLATLSKNPILVDFFNPENGDWNSHVDLGLWADALVIAPATANTMAKMATGIADNLLLTTYLSARCPVIVAPAMDLDMFSHEATQNNITVLQQRGVHIIEAATGELASGLEGKGRMEEPEKIVHYLDNFFSEEQLSDFKGKKILITAGPTREAIDPVRYIGNYSSGKMGYALANKLAERGATVVLISGPVQDIPLNAGISLIRVTTAQEMYDAAMHHFPVCDAGIMAAAVADFRPVNTATEKIKHKSADIILTLTPNPDIAKALGRIKRENQLLIGFALETHDEVDHAREKIKTKNLDFIVLNSLNDKGAGFGTDTNKITIIDKHNNIENFELKEKREVASDILNKLAQLL